MKRTLVLITAVCSLTGPTLLAVPLTWTFGGITNAGSTYNGTPIAGLDFAYRVFLDTNDPLVGNSANDFFFGPHQGRIEIQTVPAFQLNASQVAYFAAGGGPVTQVRLDLTGEVNFLGFAPIATNPAMLQPIAPVVPMVSGIGGTELRAGGPFAAFDLRLNVSSFSATLSAAAVPEGGSPWACLFISAAFLVLGGVASRTDATRNCKGLV